jgi:site-specific DNA-cytosine methylase
MGVLEYDGVAVRIRRLTEREIFRLMDVSETDIDILLNCGVPRSQLQKMAGNSIVVNVLYHLFRKMLVDKENESQQTFLF